MARQHERDGSEMGDGWEGQRTSLPMQNQKHMRPRGSPRCQRKSLGLCKVACVADWPSSERSMKLSAPPPWCERTASTRRFTSVTRIATRSAPSAIARERRLASTCKMVALTDVTVTGARLAVLGF